MISFATTSTFVPPHVVVHEAARANFSPDHVRRTTWWAREHFGLSVKQTFSFQICCVINLGLLLIYGGVLKKSCTGAIVDILPSSNAWMLVRGQPEAVAAAQSSDRWKVSRTETGCLQMWHLGAHMLVWWPGGSEWGWFRLTDSITHHVFAFWSSVKHKFNQERPEFPQPC